MDWLHGVQSKSLHITDRPNAVWGVVGSRFFLYIKKMEDPVIPNVVTYVSINV